MRPPGTPEHPEGPDLPPSGEDALRPRAGSNPSSGAHVDAERLAATALGEPAGPREDTHLRACASCREDLTVLVGLVGVGRTDDGARPVPPPAGLWERIAAGAGVSAAPARPVSGPVEPPTVDPSPRGAPTGRVTAPPSPAPPSPAPPSPASGTPAPGRSVPPPRRARRLLPVATALVVGLALGAGGLAAVRPAAPSAGEARVVATADLGPVGAARADASGTAVLRDAGSSRTLEVDVSGLPAATGYYELWLLDPAGGLVSLGVVAGGRVLVDLPADLDLDRFPVVDVSDEPLDGDPAHSSDSVLRGNIEL